MNAFHESWEHLIIVLEADASKHARFLRQRWPNRQFPPYSPEALIPELNEISKDGWELVALQPVIIGYNGDIQVVGEASLGFGKWTRTYLCTFKRRVRPSPQQSPSEWYGRISGLMPRGEDQE
jgi:hypothetical protein